MVFLVFVENHKNSHNSPYKFNAKEQDAETGYYYYGARYYNPRVSLWLNVDPLAESFPARSPYEYTFSNPVRYTDPTGMAPDQEYPDSYKGTLGKGDWRKSDRLNNSQTWKNANKYNTENNVKNQYAPYSQVADYYKWVQSEATVRGHQVRWMSGAIGLVDDLAMLEYSAFSYAVNDETEGLLKKLNVGIQNGTLPYFNDLLYGKYSKTPLTGAAAQAWDTALVNYEQGKVAPRIYASASPTALKYMNQMAHSAGSGNGWHSFIGGGSTPNFSTFGATVTDTQTRIDIPLLMLYPNSYKPKWKGFDNMKGSSGTLNSAWSGWFKGKGWLKN